jgi:hypothetical protein
MTITYRTLNDLSVEELRGVIADLNANVRYNDIKTKYGLVQMSFTANTIPECEKLIAEKSVKKFTGFLNIHSDPVLQQKAIDGGATVDANGNYIW